MTPIPPESLPDQFRCRTETTVRFRDLDAMGHVNNAVYFTYFEMGRTAYMHAIGFDLQKNGVLYDIFPFILGEISCQFIAAASLDQRLYIYVRTPHLGKKSFEFAYLITDAVTNKPIATGRSVQVCYDYPNARSQEIPASLREGIVRYEQLAPLG